MGWPVGGRGGNWAANTHPAVGHSVPCMQVRGEWQALQVGKWQGVHVTAASHPCTSVCTPHSLGAGRCLLDVRG